jgi:hypothetical protein
LEERELISENSKNSNLAKSTKEWFALIICHFVGCILVWLLTPRDVLNYVCVREMTDYIAGYMPLIALIGKYAPKPIIEFIAVCELFISLGSAIWATILCVKYFEISLKRTMMLENFRKKILTHLVYEPVIAGMFWVFLFYSPKQHLAHYNVNIGWRMWGFMGSEVGIVFIGGALFLVLFLIPVLFLNGYCIDIMILTRKITDRRK